MSLQASLTVSLRPFNRRFPIFTVLDNELTVCMCPFKHRFPILTALVNELTVSVRPFNRRFELSHRVDGVHASLDLQISDVYRLGQRVEDIITFRRFA